MIKRTAFVFKEKAADVKKVVSPSIQMPAGKSEDIRKEESFL